MLPQGTVTFLFTDVVGSTRLWEENPGAMESALAWHDELLKTVAEQQYGVVVKRTGDGMLAAFTSAVDAVLAAIAAQKALTINIQQTDIGHLTVRMALHSGVASQRDGDYYGPAVNRAARLLSVAHGEQILVSSTTQALARGNLSRKITLHNLGGYQLRDIVRPEQIYQVITPDLRRDFPALSTQTERPNNLPSQETHFVGRVRELADVTGMLRRSEIRLLTITGSGGSGKTRLALQAATYLLADFTDGVYFVDLAPVSELEQVPSTIAEALNLRTTADQDPAEILKLHLSHVDNLMVLDNLEHLLTAESNASDLTQLVVNLLTGSSRLKLLVTSRETLGLAGEWQYPLSGLLVPELGSTEKLGEYAAARLFELGAIRARPDFSLAAEAEGVIAICRAVEGIPLALELAATWVKALDCEMIASEIRNGIDFLATSQRNIPRRHRSMQAVFEYSWALLKPHERVIFQRLSVFRSGFSREAAAKVTGATLTVLSLLVDKSLLRWEKGRYSIHGLLQQFAAEYLARSDDLVKTKDDHCNYFARFMATRFEHLLGSKQQVAISEIKSEIDNVRASWHYALEIANLEAIYKMAQPLLHYYQMQNQYLEGFNASQLAVRKLDQQPVSEAKDTALVAILADMGWIGIRLGRLEEAKSAAVRCQALFDRLGIPLLTGQGSDPKLVLGVIALIKGEYDTAEELGKQALQLAEAQHHVSNRAVAYYVLTRASLVQGQVTSAQQFATLGYASSQEAGDRWFMAYSLNELGNVALAQGDYLDAVGYYEASFTLREEFDDAEGMAVALMHLGEVALKRESYSEAQGSYERAEFIYKDIYDKGGLASALNDLGRAAIAMGNHRLAQEQFQRSLQIAHEMRFTPLILSILVGIARLLIETGRVQQGLEILFFVQDQNEVEHETCVRAQLLLELARQKLPTDQLAVAQKRGRQKNLHTELNSVQSLIILEIPLNNDSLKRDHVLQAANQSWIEPLTPREMEVLEPMSEGLTNRQIAERLIVSVGTVKSYTSQIYGKLGVANRTQAVAQARTLNILSR